MEQSYHTDLVRKFEASEEASQDARAEASRCRDYYDGKQLTDDQIKALNKRKQPIVIENLIRPKIDYLCGMERQTRTDPRAYPRTEQHEDDANAVTDALRFVADDEDFDIKRSSVFQNMMIEGFGGLEVGHKQSKGGLDPALTLLDWDRLFYDPHSCRPDFSDAEYMGFITWMDIGAAKKRWADAVDVIEATVSGETSSVLDTYDDKPRWKSWTDPTRRRVRIVTMYCKIEGVWHRAVFTKSGELEPTAPSPYLDEDGQPENAMILQSDSVDRDNDRYGITRGFLTLQDEVNKRRSKFLHLSNSRPVRVSPSLGMSADDARKEMARPDGVFVGDAGEVEDLSNGNMAAGHFNLLAEAKQAIQAVGPNATMQGKSGQDQSGRAILALQQGGMTEIAPLLDNLRHFNLRVYRMIWNRIRQLWTEERWVRVTDDEKNVRFTGVNVTRGQLAAGKIKDALKAGKIDEAQAQQFGQQLQLDPAMQQPANVVAELDVDIEIDEVANAPSLQFEQFDQLVKLSGAAQDQHKPLMFKMLVEASQLRNKKKLLETVEGMEQQGPSPEQQAMQKMQIEALQAEIEKLKSETAKNMATAQKTQVDTVTGAYAQGMAA